MSRGKPEVLSGYIAATVDSDGVVYEYTMLMPTRAEAKRTINRERTWLSGDHPVRTTKFVGLHRELCTFVEKRWSEGWPRAS